MPNSITITYDGRQFAANNGAYTGYGNTVRLAIQRLNHGYLTDDDVRYHNDDGTVTERTRLIEAAFLFGVVPECATYQQRNRVRDALWDIEEPQPEPTRPTIYPGRRNNVLNSPR